MKKIKKKKSINDGRKNLEKYKFYFKDLHTAHEEQLFTALYIINHILLC